VHIIEVLRAYVKYEVHIYLFEQMGNSVKSKKIESDAFGARFKQIDLQSA